MKPLHRASTWTFCFGLILWFALMSTDPIQWLAAIYFPVIFFAFAVGFYFLEQILFQTREIPLERAKTSIQEIEVRVNMPGATEALDQLKAIEREMTIINAMMDAQIFPCFDPKKHVVKSRRTKK